MLLHLPLLTAPPFMLLLLLQFPPQRLTASVQNSPTFRRSKTDYKRSMRSISQKSCLNGECIVCCTIVSANMLYLTSVRSTCNFSAQCTDLCSSFTTLVL